MSNLADDAVLTAESEECLQRMVNEIGVMCGRRKLQVNVNKGKVTKVSEAMEYGEKMEELNCFRNLGVDLRSDRGI